MSLYRNSVSDDFRQSSVVFCLNSPKDSLRSKLLKDSPFFRLVRSLELIFQGFVIILVCRLLEIEVDKSPKPVASCAMPAIPGSLIGRRNLDFVILLWSFDCWFYSVVDKNLGPLVKTVMTRCIQCTRCVRFASQVARVQDLGILGRGSGEEIGTYKLGVESNRIRVDSRGPQVMRIIPRLNEDINEEWISDKTLFYSDNDWCEGTAAGVETHEDFTTSSCMIWSYLAEASEWKRKPGKNLVRLWPMDKECLDPLQKLGNLRNSLCVFNERTLMQKTWSIDVGI
ncbi:hypothetical protein ISN45_Aa03g001070 [Arabidopsis thaliana x Arabidopsis arenosa]|uniref:Uncharacterized protein n=1 Tax=Arabidopsis thaliana x Arabidopsis arenosa TaxID=1240361 RepID=A0A8T2AM84_9BRAS|nr:hypothetical protein ISN45_Aa03g001070 [Arabidopsis thaliana x Arabidopsis arenosa]